MNTLFSRSLRSEDQPTAPVTRGHEVTRVRSLCCGGESGETQEVRRPGAEKVQVELNAELKT